MLFSLTALLASAAAVSAVAIPIEITARAASAGMTPHDRYSSSIGVLGCKINPDRVAYWPQWPDCNNMCVRVTANGRSVFLLHVDQSGGAHDMSYDAWNYLVTGEGARQRPVQGGAIAAEYEWVDMANCRDNIREPSGRLAFSAANSMNTIAGCLGQPNSWTARNYVLYNIFTTQCTFGINEVCSLDLNQSNQPTCPHQLGLTTPLTSQPVINVDYGTGKESIAL